MSLVTYNKRVKIEYLEEKMMYTHFNVIVEVLIHVSINIYLSELLHRHNISEIGHAMLQLFLSSAAVSASNTAQARVHAINYNAWSITDRMLDIASAN